MKYLVIAVLALFSAAWWTAIWGEKRSSVDPVQVIVTQLKTHASFRTSGSSRSGIGPARQCGENPAISCLAAKLSYELELNDVQLPVGSSSRCACRIHPTSGGATDFMDYCRRLPSSRLRMSRSWSITNSAGCHAGTLTLLMARDRRCRGICGELQAVG